MLHRTFVCGFFLIASAPSLGAGPPPTAVVKGCALGARALPQQLDELKSAIVRVTAGGSSGSGFSISPDGFILTAAHVVRDAESVGVAYQDGTSAQATILRRSDAADLALLKVDAVGQPCLSVAAVRPTTGADLFVVGSPGGAALDHSVSKGIVSGFRNLGTLAVIQSDAALNPGNSGGPVLAIDGSVVGIVSFKASGAEGLGFAVAAEEFTKRLHFTLGDQSSPGPVAWVDDDASALPLDDQRSVKVTWSGEAPPLLDEKLSCKAVKTTIDSYSDKPSAHRYAGKFGLKVNRDAKGVNAAWPMKLTDEAKAVFPGQIDITKVIVQVKLESGTELSMDVFGAGYWSPSPTKMYWSFGTMITEEATKALASSPVSKVRVIYDGRPVPGVVKKPTVLHRVFNCLVHKEPIQP